MSSHSCHPILTMPYYSCHTMSYHSCHTMSSHSYHTMSYHSYHTMSCHIILAMPCHTILTMPCHRTPSYADQRPPAWHRLSDRLTCSMPRSAAYRLFFCGSSLQYSSHPSLETVVVVPLAGGFGPKPLAEPAVATHGPSSAAGHDEAFQAILDSIPVPQLHDQVGKQGDRDDE